MLWNKVVDAFVADDSEYLCVACQIDEDAVAKLCPVHAELTEDFFCTFHRIAFAFSVDMYADLSGGRLFCKSDRVHNSSLLVRGQKSFRFHKP